MRGSWSAERRTGGRQVVRMYVWCGGRSSGCALCVYVRAGADGADGGHRDCLHAACLCGACVDGRSRLLKGAAAAVALAGRRSALGE